MNSSTWATRNDAVEALTALLAEADYTIEGPVADAYDVDAIADEVLTTTGRGTTYRYTLANVDDDEFWAAVARHAR